MTDKLTTEHCKVLLASYAQSHPGFVTDNFSEDEPVDDLKVIEAWASNPKAWVRTDKSTYRETVWTPANDGTGRDIPSQTGALMVERNFHLRYPGKKALSEFSEDARCHIDDISGTVTSDEQGRLEVSIDMD